MTAADIRPDYPPEGRDGAQVTIGWVFLLVAGTVVSGVVTVLILVLDGVR